MTANGIGNEGAKVMSEVLKVNTTLTWLNMWSEDDCFSREKEKKEFKVNDR